MFSLTNIALWYVLLFILLVYIMLYISDPVPDPEPPYIYPEEQCEPEGKQPDSLQSPDRSILSYLRVRGWSLLCN